ncbi:patatin-like phospholipase family protein [Sphingobacterium griseoflavum]|uniref:PNPLA domain-containing protein n=1 Tax=Sphingobacterium griseoflavum TaxID=1474952 RepID=A0ABQ3I3F5_9SPHI|nr:patatin-like phospholipase family protein [Sphingobacterium griseoflavum]GHE45952.1 hypothetical protein GCM10017764_31560 [Sphingobacterium griseoflavum]
MVEKQKFKICLTMAGAVSAGAFTAGVVDYLLETLDLWEKAKQKNRTLGIGHADYDDSLPMHDVEIDVISGASAGGITGALAMLNLVDASYRPVNKDNPTGERNRFYQSWVNMGDDEQGGIFEKMLAKSDLKKLQKGEKPEGLLNVDPIDAIADSALQLDSPVPYPAYIAPDLDLILTTTNLRGINFQIDFRGVKKAGPVITSHAGFFRYQVAQENKEPGIPAGDALYYVLDLQDAKHLQYLKEATLSTAAFPIGFKSREVAISGEFVKRYPKYLFGDREGVKPLVDTDRLYRFNSIDGGLINNEPFAIGLSVLREKTPNLADRYAVVMIDPFPNCDPQLDGENPRPDLINVAKGMFKSLRNQAMFNQEGILDAIEGRDHTKFLVEPVRKMKLGKVVCAVKNHLASAPFSGFAGFLHRPFRVHDYHLGRLNCQAFLRYYFMVPVADVQHKFGTDPHEQALERFAIYEQRFDVHSARLFPIIPDIRVLKARTNEVNKAQFGEDAQLDYLDFPRMAAIEFNRRYRTAIRSRLESVLNGVVGNFWFRALNRLFLRRRLADKISDMMLKELSENGQLD